MKLLFILISILSAWSLTSQNTIGTISNTAAATEAYTLIATSNSTETYLINNCGEKVNQWTSEYRRGVVAYLLDNGDLLRTAKIDNSQFNVGGAAGRIEKYNWDGALIWEYNYNDELVSQHHDVAQLPNGNILILAWEVKSEAEAIQAGREAELISDQGLLSEHIIEVNPQSEIVWEWHLWDHLVQDHDPSVSNFGVIDNPRKLNINHTVAGANLTNPDFMHYNAIDYNSQLDQILLSSRSKSEIHIIDHSTTTTEAATSTGGQYGYGGDFIYRYGNPEVYASATATDHRFYGQHDAHWIADDLPNGGKIMVFNNGAGRPGTDYSQVDIIDPPIDTEGNYILSSNGNYGPEETDYTYNGNQTFDASRLSGAQMLKNGNISICLGPSGQIFEIDENENRVWNYINPISTTGPLSQGQSPVGNGIFRAYKYDVDYAGFDDKEIIAGDKLELDPTDNCTIYVTSTSADIDQSTTSIYPNPTASTLHIDMLKGSNQLIIIDMNGQVVATTHSESSTATIDLTDLADGMYILNICNDNTTDCTSSKLIKI